MILQLVALQDQIEAGEALSPEVQVIGTQEGSIEAEEGALLSEEAIAEDLFLAVELEAGRRIPTEKHSAEDLHSELSKVIINILKRVAI